MHKYCFIIFMLSMLLFQSCSISSRYYQASDANLMHVGEKGAINVAMSPIDLGHLNIFKHYGFQGAYSPLNNLSIYGQFNASQSIEKEYTFLLDDTFLLNEKYVNGEIAIGTYFTKFLRAKDKDKQAKIERFTNKYTFDFIAGFGLLNYDKESISKDIYTRPLNPKLIGNETLGTRYFIQIGNHFDLKILRFSVGLRPTWLNIKKMTLVRERYQKLDELSYLLSFDPHFIIEASARLQFGFKNYRIFLGSSLSYQGNRRNSVDVFTPTNENERNYFNSTIFLAGIELSLDKILKKRKQKRN